MVSWAALLDEAIRKPGYIHEAYSRFRYYSLGSQLLPLFAGPPPPHPARPALHRTVRGPG